MVATAPLLPPMDTKSIHDLLVDRNLHIALIKQHLAAAQNRIKLHVDKNRTDKEFGVGEQVLLCLQPYAQSSVVNMPYPNISYKFFGPYKAVERIGKAAYWLELPENSAVHLVFHVSQLKFFTPDYTPTFAQLPTQVDFYQVSLLPQEILEWRLVKKGNAAVPQVKIKWLGLPDTTTSWEDWYVLLKKFPAISSWGQDGSLEGEV
jgi:hypothetical protein